MPRPGDVAECRSKGEEAIRQIVGKEVASTHNSAADEMGRGRGN
jgi:hypothetical protein